MRALLSAILTFGLSLVTFGCGQDIGQEGSRVNVDHELIEAIASDIQTHFQLSV